MRHKTKHKKTHKKAAKGWLFQLHISIFKISLFKTIHIWQHLGMSSAKRVLPEQIKHLSLLAGPVGLNEDEGALFGRSPN